MCTLHNLFLSLALLLFSRVFQSIRPVHALLQCVHNFLLGFFFNFYLYSQSFVSERALSHIMLDIELCVLVRLVCVCVCLCAYLNCWFHFIFVYTPCIYGFWIHSYSSAVSNVPSFSFSLSISFCHVRGGLQARCISISLERKIEPPLHEMLKCQSDGQTQR